MKLCSLVSQVTYQNFGRYYYNVRQCAAADLGAMTWLAMHCDSELDWICKIPRGAAVFQFSFHIKVFSNKNVRLFFRKYWETSRSDRRSAFNLLFIHFLSLFCVYFSFLCPFLRLPGNSSPEWIMFKEAEYKFFDHRTTWDQAQRICSWFDSSLASVHSADEQMFLANTLRKAKYPSNTQKPQTWMEKLQNQSHSGVISVPRCGSNYSEINLKTVSTLRWWKRKGTAGGWGFTPTKTTAVSAGLTTPCSTTFRGRSAGHTPSAATANAFPSPPVKVRSVRSFFFKEADALKTLTEVGLFCYIFE